MITSQLLVGDVGGTNVRFALAGPDSAGYEQEATLRCADFGSPEAAISHYLKSIDAGMPEVVCLAVAGPVFNGRVEFTNSHWRVEEAHLTSTLGVKRARLMNDFAAVAMSVPVLNEQEQMTIGHLAPDLSRGSWCIGVMGPGTGLGAAGLVRAADRFCPLVTEAGHAGFSPATPLQMEILKVMLRKYDRVSIERLISGPGVENLYLAISEVRGVEVQHRHASEIFQAAVEGLDETATEAVESFYQILGQVAGDFVLSIGAFDGIYLAGGVLQRYGESLRESRFRKGFESKGRLGVRLRATPAVLITHPQPGLLGASQVAREIYRELPAGR